MKRWPTKPLAELIAIKKGKKAPAVLAAPTKTSLRYLQIEDLRPSANLKYCEPFTCPRATKSDAIIAWDGANAGTVSCNLDGHIGSTLAILRPIAAVTLSAPFLSRFLEDNFGYLQKTATGATIPHVSKGALTALQLPVPSLAEQERIVKLLDEADELRKLRTQGDQRTGALIPALFHEMFGDVATNSKKFPTEQLDNCIQLLGGAAFKSEDFCGEGIPVIRIGNANKGEIDLHDLVYLPRSFIESHARYLLKPGDIVVTLTGTVGKDDYGNVCFVNSKFDEWFLNQRVAKIEFVNDRITTWFLFWAFRQPVFKALLIQNNRGVRQANISNKDILALEIPIPPLPLQKEFAQRVKEIREFEAEQVTSRTHLDALFQSMLHRAFNGTL